MNKVKITIGDWSEDGHEQYDEFVFDTNKSVEDIQEAYKRSCNLTGLIFGSNTNYTGIQGLNWHHPEYKDRQVFVNYEQDQLSDLVKEVFKKHNIQLLDSYAPEEFVELMIDFIKLSLPDLEMQEAPFKKSELKGIAPINGWWCKGLNESWGYGLYY